MSVLAIAAEQSEARRQVARRFGIEIEELELRAKEHGVDVGVALAHRRVEGYFPWEEPKSAPPSRSLPEGTLPEPNLAPKESPVPGKVLRKVNAAELRLRGTPDLDYLPFLGQPGYIVRSWTTLIAGYPKAGKTELMTRLCLGWQSERVLYVTEEPETIWAARLSRVPGGWQHMDILFGLGTEQTDILHEVATCSATVVVVDTVRNLLQLRDETDNSEVARVLTPLIAVCRESGKSLVLLHHIRKGGGQHGEGITGGHAFLGIVDAALEILREQNLGENKRRVRGWGRVVAISEMIYVLDEDGTMRALGEPGLVALDQVKERVLDALDGQWCTARDLVARLCDPKPSDRQLREALASLVDQGNAERNPPQGKPGATYRYRLPQPHPERRLPTTWDHGAGLGEPDASNAGAPLLFGTATEEVPF